MLLLTVKNSRRIANLEMKQQEILAQLIKSNFSRFEIFEI